LEFGWEYNFRALNFKFKCVLLFCVIDLFEFSDFHFGHVTCHWSRARGPEGAVIQSVNGLLLL
jgi:hypothetical protein